MKLGYLILLTIGSFYMAIYEEVKFDFSTFIGGWYIPKKDCEELIKFYENNIDKTYTGNVGKSDKDPRGLVNSKIKKCSQLTIDKENFFSLSNYINHLSNILNCYKKKYPFCDSISPYTLKEPINIQHYKPKEGFYEWHTENLGCNLTKNRHLVFMTYLNTIENGGTEFYHQNIKTECKTGLTLIWPSAWTHIHRGIVSMKDDKYIITGWISFDSSGK